MNRDKVDDTAVLGERVARRLYLENVYALGYAGYLARVLASDLSRGRCAEAMGRDRGPAPFDPS